MTERDTPTEGYGGRHSPLVSIGVPVFSAERWLSRALDSLLAQEHDRLEIIICDNASQDDTAGICREYARRDSRIRFFENETNVGALANFSRVLSLAAGRYCGPPQTTGGRRGSCRDRSRNSSHIRRPVCA
jgi:cellulose synthase/poly-beta-1,6-N-acetylglucosamine synthase-like glycosyltransferase